MSKQTELVDVLDLLNFTDTVPMKKIHAALVFLAASFYPSIIFVFNESHNLLDMINLESIDAGVILGTFITLAIPSMIVYMIFQWAFRKSIQTGEYNIPSLVGGGMFIKKMLTVFFAGALTFAPASNVAASSGTTSINTVQSAAFFQFYWGIMDSIDDSINDSVDLGAIETIDSCCNKLEIRHFKDSLLYVSGWKKGVDFGWSLFKGEKPQDKYTVGFFCGAYCESAKYELENANQMMSESKDVQAHLYQIGEHFFIGFNDILTADDALRIQQAVKDAGIQRAEAIKIALLIKKVQTLEDTQ